MEPKTNSPGESDPRLIVILDTNILVGNMPKAEPNLLLKSLLEAARNGEMELCIPFVVEAEWINSQSESIRDAAARFAGSYRRLASYGFAADLPHVDAAALIEARSKKLSEVTGSKGVRVLPTTEIPHNELVERALRRRRPFRENGSGYRDALIWQSVVEISGTSSRTVFVSNDLRDFGVGTDHSELHADLRTDLDANTNSGTVEFFKDLGKFVEAHVKPGTRATAELKELGTRQDEKREQFIRLLKDAIRGQSLDRDLLDASSWESNLEPDEEEVDVESAVIREVVSVNSISTVFVQDDGPNLSAYLEIESECELEIEQTTLRREWGESTTSYESVHIEWTVVLGVEIDFDIDSSLISGVTLQHAQV